MDDKAQLEQEYARILAKLDIIEARERKAEHEKLLGKCFKYLNSYGSSRPSWWLYAKVTGTDGYWPRTLTFQVTCDREIIVKEKDTHSGMGKPGNGWIEIPKSEWNKQWRGLVKRISAVQS